MRAIRIQACVGLAGLLLAAGTAHAAAGEYVENLDFTNTVSITFSGSTATVDDSAGSGVTVSVDGAHVSIESDVEGVDYILSGSSSAGSFAVYGVPACRLTLSGLDLAADYYPAVNVSTTNGCYVVLEDGTDNTLSDGALYLEDIPGAFYSAGPLAISGRGRMTLNVQGEEHGIYSPTNVWIRGGDIAVSGSPKDALHVGGTFQMDNGSLALNAESDAVDADRVTIGGGSISIRSTPDNVEGIKCDGDMLIEGGIIHMVIQGDRSKGLSCGGDLEISSGSLSFLLSGDVYLKSVTNETPSYTDAKYCSGISCNGDLTMNDGRIVMTHTGRAWKGISVDGAMTMADGTINITSSGGSSDTFTNEDQETDMASSDCIKVDGALALLGGTVTLLNTGDAGDCLSTEGTLVVGVDGVDNLPVITAETSGEKVYVSGSDYANPKAVTSEGDVTINGGIMRLTTANDGGEGLEGQAELVVNGGEIQISAYDDCIQFQTGITINDGTITCTGTGNGEGIESKDFMVINGGQIEITAGDDAINALGTLEINDGLIYCCSSDNDAIDSNGIMTINGGVIIASGDEYPEESFDSDAGVYINGGILVGTAGNVMSEPSTSSGQRCIIYSGDGTEGVILQVQLDGTDALVYEIPRTYSSSSSSGGRPGQSTSSSGMYLLFSSSDVTYNASGTILTGGTASGGTAFHGFYTGATVSGGTQQASFTVNSVVNNVQ